MKIQNGQLIKDAIGFQKTLFDNAYNLLVKYQDGTEELTNSILERYVPVPEVWRSQTGEWVRSLKDNRTQFKNLVDEGFTNFGNIVSN